MNENDIRDALSDITDDHGSPVLRFIKKILINDDGVIVFALEYEDLNDEIKISEKNLIKDKCIDAVKKVPWVKDVKVAVTSNKKQEQPPKKEKVKFDNISKILLIASGKGGVGKSTVSANIAITMMNMGLKVGLLDADVYGPSLITLFGVNKKPAIKDDKMCPIEKYGISLMSIGFLVDPDEAVVWRGPMLTKALHHMMRFTNWPNLDYLIIDTPPGTGDIHLTLSENYIIDAAIVVTTPQTLSTVDAQKGINMFNKLNIPVLGIIENMSYFSSNGNISYPFGKDGGKTLSKKNGLEFLGEIPLILEISKSSDSGKPITYFGGNDIALDAFNLIVSNICSKQ